jgi:hypothetical protein
MDPLPFAELLGIELVSASPDSIVAELTVREDLCTLGSAIHGGVMMAFADTRARRHPPPRRSNPSPPRQHLDIAHSLCDVL